MEEQKKECNAIDLATKIEIIENVEAGERVLLRRERPPRERRRHGVTLSLEAHRPQLAGEPGRDAVVVFPGGIDRRDADQVTEAPEERGGMAVDVGSGRHAPQVGWKPRSKATEKGCLRLGTD